MSSDDASVLPKIKTLIIDGKNLAMRSWYAYQGQLSVEGLGSTNLIHGSLAELFRHVAKYRPERTIITWDEKSAFRRKLWAGYKVRTSKLGPVQFNDIDYQMSIFREALGNLAVSQVQCTDVEGDDLVALAVMNSTWRPALVVSTDRDFWQLIREGVWIYDPRKKFHLGLTGFSRLTGFDSPGHYLAFKCLRGDPGDGVPPAVNRMGESKAKKLSRDLHLPSLDQLREVSDMQSMTFNGDAETERNLARNFKLVSLHAALFIQKHALAEVTFDFPTPDYDGFMSFCAKYKLSVVAKAYGEVCQYL
jgi:5'-3' exonuclease